MSTWTIDAAHSTIGFKVKHLMVSTVRGSFTDFEGSIEAADDTFAGAAAHFSAKTASVNTHNDMRDGHIKSPDFFDVAQFPTVSFASKSFTKKNDEAYEMTGDLTLHGVTKEIKLDVSFNGVGPGMDGKRVVSFDATGMIDRRDFGISIAMPLEGGGLVVSNDVALDIQIEAKEA